MGSARVTRAALVWLLIDALAVANGGLREGLLVPRMGMGVALPLSGVILSVMVCAVTWLLFGFLNAKDTRALWGVGVQWVVMTLAFEFLFGHFMAGKPWMTLLRNFDVTTGDLFSVVLLVSLLAPWCVGKIRGVI